MKIEWTAAAEADLDETFEFIAQDVPAYAEQYVDRIIDTVSILGKYPRAGRRVREIGQDQIRELVYRKHRIIYKLQPNNILILAVIHGRRGIERLKQWGYREVREINPALYFAG